ncbi:hypothetical protein ABW19_dt0210300 [Dactylella cylindrospora]|nr:hypothetical protein ABW19_dt0210300 [Dactylella cylindrospora]
MLLNQGGGLTDTGYRNKVDPNRDFELENENIALSAISNLQSQSGNSDPLLNKGTQQHLNALQETQASGNILEAGNIRSSDTRHRGGQNRESESDLREGGARDLMADPSGSRGGRNEAGQPAYQGEGRTDPNQQGRERQIGTQIPRTENPQVSDNLVVFARRFGRMLDSHVKSVNAISRGIDRQMEEVVLDILRDGNTANRNWYFTQMNRLASARLHLLVQNEQRFMSWLEEMESELSQRDDRFNIREPAGIVLSEQEQRRARDTQLMRDSLSDLAGKIGLAVPRTGGGSTEWRPEGGGNQGAQDQGQHLGSQGQNLRNVNQSRGPGAGQ